MEILSPFHVIIILILLTFLVPLYRIISRTGHSGWWCVLFFIPPLNWIFIWVFAFIRWPAVDRR